jgi:antitoxin (DNA-binding transcriptional repressor) of toxin-antitoxin stability system
MTATEVARSFSEVLDRVERGETFVVTRKGRSIGTITKSHVANSKALREFFRDNHVDADFGRDVEAVREIQRAHDIANPRPTAWAE